MSPLVRFPARPGSFQTFGKTGEHRASYAALRASQDIDQPKLDSRTY